MSRALRTLSIVVAALIALGLAASASGDQAESRASQYVAQDVCPTPSGLNAQCFSQVLADPTTRRPVAFAAPAGYGPSQLLSAYRLGGVRNNGAGQTIAIVDAFDDPNAQSDLNAYRSQFGLPPCTAGNGCFHKIGQDGGPPPPTTDTGWGLEISLDLDMASAICRQCDITLIEADSNSFANLGAAAGYAKTHYDIASNSYGLYENQLTPAQLSSLRSTYGPDYRTSSGQVTVSTGDDGYGAAFPADLQYVDAIGGTTLHRNTTVPRGWTERAWSGAGSGCTLQTPHQSWEPTLPDCTKRAESDVSAVADPNTGVAVYDTFGFGGWLVVGGTSASSPIVAGVFGLAENAATIPSYAQNLYSHPSSLYDVKVGSNGSCGGSELCTAGPGWDGPTGLGTPKGIAAF